MAGPRKALLKRAERAFAEAQDDLTDAFRAEVEDAKWAWPNDTIRSNGSRAGSPRSVVDTGAFRDSYSRENVGPSTYRHAWTVPYAAAVINGAVLKNGSVLPARDITQGPLAQLPEFFARRFNAAATR